MYHQLGDSVQSINVVNQLLSPSIQTPFLRTMPKKIRFNKKGGSRLAAPKPCPAMGPASSIPTGVSETSENSARDVVTNGEVGSAISLLGLTIAGG